MIAVLLSGWSARVSAEDLFLGRILSVDRDAGRLTVLLVEEESAGTGQGQPSGQPVEVAIHPNQLPGDLSPGSIVRIWGELGDGGKALNAARLYGSPHGAGGKDATGVRRRIGKGRSLYGGKGGAKGHGRH